MCKLKVGIKIFYSVDFPVVFEMCFSGMIDGNYLNFSNEDFKHRVKRKKEDYSSLCSSASKSDILSATEITGTT